MYLFISYLIAKEFTVIFKATDSAINFFKGNSEYGEEISIEKNKIK